MRRRVFYFLFLRILFTKAAVFIHLANYMQSFLVKPVSMNNKPVNPTIILILLLFSFSKAGGQGNVPKLELGLGLSSYIYQGDLSPEDFGSYKTIRIGVNLFVSKLISPSVALRTNLAIGGLRGDDSKYSEPEYRQQRNFKFKTGLIELSELIVWNPLKKNYADKGFYPYLFAGGGISFVNIKRDWSNYNAEFFNNTDVSLRLAEDSAHELPRVIPFVPVGGGLRYNLNYKWGFMIESTYRVLFTDYLDGFSKAANPEKKDKYHSLTIGAVYRIGKKNPLDCPVVKF
jgi:hypothetical protein